jgi:hypothetical protein
LPGSQQAGRLLFLTDATPVILSAPAALHEASLRESYKSDGTGASVL